LIHTIWRFIEEEKILGPVLGSIIGGLVTFTVLYINIYRERRKDKRMNELNYLKSYIKIEFFLDKLQAPLQNVADLIREKGIFNIEDYHFDNIEEIIRQCRKEIEKINIDYIPLEIVKSFIRLQDLLLHIENKVKSRDKLLHYQRASRDIENIFKEIRSYTKKQFKKRLN
jgi:hypothetical protein